MLPNASTARFAIPRTSSKLATSATTVTARPPEPSISTRTLANPSGSRATSTTFAPRSAAIFAVASPIPLEAPVITTTWSSIRLSFTPITALPYKDESVDDSRILPQSILDHREPSVDPVLLAAGVLADVRVAQLFELGPSPPGRRAVMIPAVENDLGVAIGNELRHACRDFRRREVLRCRQMVFTEIHERQHLEQREVVAAVDLRL